MGSRSNIEKAYIAGFLDGDGSLMLQIKKRKDTKRGFRFMATMCFYQDTRHEKSLFWIKDALGIGYISRRNDSMTELRINGFSTVKSILLELEPFVKFKSVQANALIKACSLLEKRSISELSKEQLIGLVDLILLIQNENYATKHKKTKAELLKIIDLTP